MHELPKEMTVGKKYWNRAPRIGNSACVGLPPPYSILLNCGPRARKLWPTCNHLDGRKIHHHSKAKATERSPPLFITET